MIPIDSRQHGTLHQRRQAGPHGQAVVNYPCPRASVAYYLGLVSSWGQAMYLRSLAIVLTAAFLAVSRAFAEAPLRAPAPVEQRDEKKDRDKLTDAAIVALIIAASIAAYKATGKPCACPGDTMRNGRACGGNSAYARAGGYKPLCFPADITPAMIAAYRATRSVPGLR